MFSRLVTLISSAFILSACVSVENSGREYFQLGNKVKGVEPADALIERMNKDRELREITLTANLNRQKLFLNAQSYEISFTLQQ